MLPESSTLAIAAIYTTAQWRILTGMLELLRGGRLPVKLKDWLRDVRGKRPPEEVYVDSAAAPAEPEGPYRARMAVATHQAAPEGIDVSEREVVTGTLQLVYRTRCPCGHQWDALHFQRMSICANCGRAVLVEAPKPPSG